MVSTKRFVTTEVDNVEMPETPTFKRSWVVDCLVVKQIAKVKDVSVNNGRVDGSCAATECSAVAK